MKPSGVLLVLGAAAAVFFGGIATIRQVYPPQYAHKDNDIRVLPDSDPRGLLQQTTEDVTRAPRMPEAPAEESQLASRREMSKEVHRNEKRLVGVVKNADGTYTDIYEEGESLPEEDAFSAISLTSGELPSDIAKAFQSMEGPVGARVLEMNRQIRTGIQAGTHTDKGYEAERILRNQILSRPELRGLNISVSCAAKLCELQAVRSMPGVTTESIDSALAKVALTKEFADLYRSSGVMQLSMGGAPYWISYWEERD